MKNKRLINVLVPLVLLIWGMIFYKIFTRMSDNDDKSMVNRNMQKLNKDDSSKDTFTIKANYRDPFLDRSYKPVVKSGDNNGFSERRNKSVGFNPRNQPVMEIRLPEIKYYGLIDNPQNKQKVGLFKVSNKDLILKEGESADDLKISRLFKDSVMLIYRNNKKTIKKNNYKS